MTANYWRMTAICLTVLVLCVVGQRIDKSSNENTLLSLQEKKVKLLEEYITRNVKIENNNGTSTFDQILTEHLDFSQTLNQKEDRSTKQQQTTRVRIHPAFAKQVRPEFGLDLSDLASVKQYQTVRFRSLT